MILRPIDPHKSGYVPFPAGSLLYRDERMKYLVTWTAPYLAKGKKGESLGMYGVEGRYATFPIGRISSHYSSSWSYDVLTANPASQCIVVNLVVQQWRHICSIESLNRIRMGMGICWERFRSLADA